jgi:hypothetical protein
MRKTLRLMALIGVVVLPCLGAVGATPSATLHNSLNQDGNIYLNDMQFTIPSGWTLVQDGVSDGTTLVGIANADQYITLFSAAGTTMDIKTLYVNPSEIATGSATESYGPFSWNALDSSHQPQAQAEASRAVTTVYVHGFSTTFNGRTYYGFSRASSAAAAKQAAASLLGTMRVPMLKSRSITDATYTGKKYYFGWGDATGSPDEMVNEVHYDVKHTNDIFTQDVGGGYIPTTLFDSNANGTNIPQAWQTITQEMTASDMYVQYSSGHGYQGGLAVGVTDEQVVSAVLGMPARELVVFTMACFSGGIVDAFNQQKSTWQNWQSQGRTLFVLTSSTADVESQTGPGTDPDEPNGPDGSAGSAFGFALWKALSGEADGFEDGVKDGFVSLAEIRDYTTWRTSQDTSSQQVPVFTGVYNDNLIMNRVPSAALLAQLEKEGGTHGLTESQIMEKIQELDRILSVQR